MSQVRERASTGAKLATVRPSDRITWQKLAWFVVFWVGSITALAIVAYGIRLMIKKM